MSYNLLELTQNYFLGSTVRQVSTAFGEPDTRISAALRSVVPLVLGGLLTRTQEPGGAAELTEWAQQVHQRGLLTDLSGLLAGLRPAPAAAPVSAVGSLPTRGADMMRALLKDAYEPALAGISQQAGVPALTVSSLFSVAVAAVLGLLGRHIAQQNLDATGVKSYLGSQRADILGALAALPAGLGQDPAHPAPGAPALGVAPVPVPTPPASVASLNGLLPTQASEAATPGTPAAAPSAVPAAAAQPVVRAAPPRQAVYPAAPAPVAASRWPWLLLLVLVLAVVGYLLVGRRPQAGASELGGATPVAPARSAAPAAHVAAPSGQYEAALGTYRYEVGADTTLRLPTGTSLTVGRRSTEAQLWGLLTARPQSRTTDKTRSGIPLDRVYFDPATATLTAASQAQLANLAALLGAFPQATLKVGGFTDNQGSAEANLLLSADRANAVRSTLVAQGLAATRVAAQGYGQTHPAASNATPAGQAQNRRVAVLLTSQ